MALSAVDCISRGLVNLRANWELVIVQMLQVLLVSILILIGFLPPLAVIGWSSLNTVEPTFEGVEALLQGVVGFLGRGGEAWALIAIGLLVSSIIWLIAMLVYCFFQGGINGILRAGDRQAPPGRPTAWRWFRTYSTRDLGGFGARYLWRYFWLLNLFAAIGMSFMLPFFAWGVLTQWGNARWGLGAAMGIGCGLLLPLLFGLFVLVYWAGLAQADLPQENSGVWVATRRALRAVGRRLGTLLLLSLVWLAAIASVAIATTLLSLPLSLVAGSGELLRTAVGLAIYLLQWVANSALSVAFIGVLVAIMRSESLQGASP